MEYKLPDKSLLEKRSEELKDDKKYYSLSKLVYKKDFHDRLVIPMGIDSTKEKYFLDLKNVSGMFISGETGSGKSMFLNSIIVSLLLKNKPNELQFIFIDQRNVEFNLYEGIPHLYTKPISTLNEIIDILNKVINIIEERKEMYLIANVKNIDDYNEVNRYAMPHIIIIIDEANDILNANKKIIERILNDGYIFGIHLVIATSSYFKNIIDSKLLNNFDYVLTFDLASEEQANFIKLDKSHLLTVYGEALVKCRNNDIIDIQTPYVSDQDIKGLVNFIKSGE